MTIHRAETRTAVSPSLGERQGPKRPSAMTAAVVAVIVGLIGFGVGWLVFSSSDQDGTRSTALPEVIERWADAWEARDADAFAAVYEPDGYFDGILGVGYEGQDEIRSSIDQYWAFTGGTTQQLEPAYVFANEVGAVVIWDIVTTDESGEVRRSQDVTDFEWAWDDENPLRSTSMNW